MCWLLVGLACARDEMPLLGIVSVHKDDLKLHATSAYLERGSEFGLVDASGRYRCCLAISGEGVTENESPLSDDAGTTIKSYPVELRGDLAADRGVRNVFGVAIRTGVSVVSSSAQAYVLRDGITEMQLTVCTSSEGLHVALKRSNGGSPAHLYYYLGYDVEPTCP